MTIRNVGCWFSSQTMCENVKFDLMKLHFNGFTEKQKKKPFIIGGIIKCKKTIRHIVLRRSRIHSFAQTHTNIGWPKPKELKCDNVNLCKMLRNMNATNTCYFLTIKH